MKWEKSQEIICSVSLRKCCLIEFRQGPLLRGRVAVDQSAGTGRDSGDADSTAERASPLRQHQRHFQGPRVRIRILPRFRRKSGQLLLF